MAYIIVYTLNKNIAQRLYSLEKSYPELFVLNLGHKCKGLIIKVMKNNGFVLSYLASLDRKYPNRLFIWASERVYSRWFPEKCIEGGEWLNKTSGRRPKDIPKAIGLTKQELGNIKLNINFKKED